MLLMQVQISLLESGLYHLANMSLSHFHLLHLLQELYLVELADGGLDWLIETGGLQSNPPFLRGGVRNSGGLDFEVEGRQEEVQKEQK